MSRGESPGRSGALPTVAFAPIGEAELVERLAEFLATFPAAAQDGAAAHAGTATLRVAIDGAGATRPHELAQALIEPLRRRSRPVTHLRDDLFWRDASLRLEYGRHDLQSFAEGWLDHATLRREVLDPLGPGGSGRFLPSLRDPVSNRMTRAATIEAPPGSIVLVSGALLIRPELEFDVRIHLAMSAAALARHTPAEAAWTLPAFASYDEESEPSDRADVVVRLEDPRRPAIRFNASG
ncbi:hypothetical protein SAMN05892883_2474 [Jatrophihabitans sp. GAS493]|uniref:uridine kinase n=1 Tax=Jatrophihabitans sp. GAS493 TaxID=1907575 RepID=UPI000BC037A5|nr:uridine kinase [Jatrophihabitans sp. GAS493]SOD73185.1 hypothetical protein SAMN05892883_2474 [Jatrophihabitans sp. GAS493]